MSSRSSQYKKRPDQNPKISSDIQDHPNSKQAQSNEDSNSSGILTPDARITLHEAYTLLHRGAGEGLFDDVVTIQDILSWIEKKNDARGTGLEPPIPDDDLERVLQGRHQMFLIDNSGSMKSHKHSMRDVITALGHLVKRYDPDGMELCSTRDNKRIRHKDRKGLLKLFDSLEFEGDTDIERSLGRVVEEFADHSSEHGLVRSFFKGQKARKVSIYVLTDGQWGCNEKNLCGIPDLTRIVARHYSHLNFGIQFITFGQSETDSWLFQLDRCSRKYSMDLDIFDVTPASGSVLKMMFGSINNSWDVDPTRPIGLFDL